MVDTYDDRMKLLAGILPAWVKQFRGTPTHQEFTNNYTSKLNFFSERDEYRFYLAPDCFVELINMRIKSGTGTLEAGEWQVTPGVSSRHTVITFTNTSQVHSFYDRTLTKSKTVTESEENEMRHEFLIGLRLLLRFGNLITDPVGFESEITSEYMNGWRRLSRVETHKYSSDAQRLTFICNPNTGVEVSRQESTATAIRHLTIGGVFDCDFRLKSKDDMDLTIIGGIEGMTQFLHGYGHDNVTGTGSEAWIKHAAKYNQTPWDVGAFGIKTANDLKLLREVDPYTLTEKKSSVQYSDYQLTEVAVPGMPTLSM